MIDDVDRPDPHESPSADAPAKKRGGGPRTAEGKEQSKRNALKHGMRAKVLLPDDLAAAVVERTAELTDEFRPGSPYEEWLVGQMALAATRLDRCAELAIADLRRCVDRALLCWEEDRRKTAEDLGARLPKDPARVAQALGRSRQGADWLIERWEGLGQALATNNGWDEAQRRLSFDLLGVAPELRNGSTRVPPEADTEALDELVKQQVARLRGRRERSLDALDEAERAMAAAGMPLDEDASTARIRRYEASCRRALLGARAELLRSREGPPATAEGDSGGQAAKPLPTRPPVTDSAAIWLEEHSTAARLMTSAVTPEEAIEETPEDVVAPEEAVVETPEEAVAETPVEIARPVIARAFAVTPVPARPPAPPANRRERRARESQARRSAHRDARAPGLAASGR